MAIPATRRVRSGVVFSAVIWGLIGLAPGGRLEAQSDYAGCPQWSHEVSFVNACSAKVHITETPGCFGAADYSIAAPPFDGGRCWPEETGGGFHLDPGEKKTFSFISCWSGNFGLQCQTCKTKVATLAELTFDSGLSGPPDHDPPVHIDTTPANIDTYDISMVDGFSYTLQMAPDKNVSSRSGNCETAGCTEQPSCPAMLTDGDACLSPCQYVSANPDAGDVNKYCCVCNDNTACSGDTVPGNCLDQYGCSPFSPPGNANPGSACCPWFEHGYACKAASADRAWDSWAQEYIADIKAVCNKQYAWQFDDDTSTFTCSGSDTVPMNYTITVHCPSASAK